MAECVECQQNFPTNHVRRNWETLFPLPIWNPEASPAFNVIYTLEYAGRPRFYRNRTYGICRQCAEVLMENPATRRAIRDQIERNIRTITGLQSLTRAVNSAFAIQRDPRYANFIPHPPPTAMQIPNPHPVPIAALPRLQPARITDRSIEDLLLQPSAVTPSIAAPLSNPETCDICALEKPASEFVTTHCGHRFCRNCLVTWVNEFYNAQRKNTCPVCRRNIVRPGR